MNITVGTTALPLPLPPTGAPTVQNLGPGVLYFDRVDTVTPETGIRIEPGAIYTLPTTTDPYGRGPRGNPAIGPIWLVSSAADTDVRFFV